MISATLKSADEFCVDNANCIWAHIWSSLQWRRMLPNYITNQCVCIFVYLNHFIAAATETAFTRSNLSWHPGRRARPNERVICISHSSTSVRLRKICICQYVCVFGARSHSSSSRQPARLPDRQTNRQTDRQTDMQTNRKVVCVCVACSSNTTRRRMLCAVPDCSLLAVLHAAPVVAKAKTSMTNNTFNLGEMHCHSFHYEYIFGVWDLPTNNSRCTLHASFPPSLIVSIWVAPLCVCVYVCVNVCSEGKWRWKLKLKWIMGECD